MKPTNTPKPTVPPQPTNSPVPSATVKPTTTPKPTNTPQSAAGSLLGDLVWYDDNHNGVQDPSESGSSAIQVNLYNITGTFLATTRTDEHGRYFFAELQQGSYRLEFVLPRVMTVNTSSMVSTQENGTDGSNGIIWRTPAIIIAAGTADLLWDVGLILVTGDPSLASEEVDLYIYLPFVTR